MKDSTSRRCKAGQHAMIVGRVNTGKIVRIIKATNPVAPYFLRNPWLVESLGTPLLGCGEDRQPGRGMQAEVADGELFPLPDGLEPTMLNQVQAYPV